MSDGEFNFVVRLVIEAIKPETQDPETRIAVALGAAVVLARAYGVTDEGVETALSEILNDVERVH